MITKLNFIIFIESFSIVKMSSLIHPHNKYFKSRKFGIAIGGKFEYLPRTIDNLNNLH